MAKKKAKKSHAGKVSLRHIVAEIHKVQKALIGKKKTATIVRGRSIALTLKKLDKTANVLEQECDGLYV
ncbi:MAG TPA: hypothetical protein VKI43_02525 [Vicinamibacterales bacterium]|nr:hypothetical protein [Vicinamibacterales bacterium]